MSFKWFFIGLGLFATAIAGYFGWRYFFDPKGIYIADGEICTSNESKQTLVFSVESKPGSKVIALLGPQERVCAPSSVKNPTGEIRAGETEDELECVYILEEHGKFPFLAAYQGEGNCDWGFLSR